MKLLIYAAEYPPCYSSGIGNVVCSLKKEFEIIGISCIIHSTICSDIDLCKGPLIKKLVNIRSLYVSYFWYKACQYIRSNKCSRNDLIWAHDPLPYFLMLVPKDRKVIVTFHTIHSFYLQQSKYPKFVLYVLRKLEIESLKNLSDNIKITAVSTKVIDELESLGIDRKRISYIPNGVDINLFKPRTNKEHLRKKFGIPQKALVILSVGKLKEQKQPLKLIDIFSSIENEIKEAFLVIAGKGELFNELISAAKKKRITNIKFLGYIPENDKPDLYSCADYYIMTSKYEGQPLTLLEAFSSGLPCIVSNIPNLNIVNDANCGILVDLSNIDKATNEVLDYLHHDNSEHAKNARDYSKNNISWGRIAERYKDEFDYVK